MSEQQGSLPDEERAARAIAAFTRDMSRDVAASMESCIRCGHCAEACHFHVASGDPAHTPIWKLRPFQQAWKREAGPFAWLYRALGLEPAVTAGELREWQALVYDTCNLCGRCSMVCPMGIDIASLVGLARHAMFEAGLVPQELWDEAERAERECSPLGARPRVLKERIAWLAEEHGVAIPLDKPRADFLVTLSSIEIMKYPASIVALARILEHAGEDWTLRSDGYEATNFGMLAGSLAWQRDMSLRLIRAAIACGARTLLLPECGHAYGALRWQGANMLGEPLPFEVLHVSEYLARGVAQRRIRLRRAPGTVTFHDPCQVSRRGGATQAPREVLRALGAELREMPQGGDANWCCGGGGGVVAMQRANEHRRRAFRIKIEQVEAAGPARLVSSCANCRLSFDDGGAHYGWDRKMESLLELAAAQLAPAA